jgi:putative transposase
MWSRSAACEVGDSEDGAFWTAFLRSRKARGPTGVQLDTSDAHTGLKQATAAVLAGCWWQRCRVHSSETPWPGWGAQGLSRDGRRHQPHHLRPAHRRRGRRPGRQGGRNPAAQVPTVAALLAEAKEDLTTFRHFPVAH